jgi:uncharacterized protein YndB with AHSA1/START domain
VKPRRRGSAHIEFPNELDVLLTREFDAPIALVFDVLTKPEYVSKWALTPRSRLLDALDWQRSPRERGVLVWRGAGQRIMRLAAA